MTPTSTAKAETQGERHGKSKKKVRKLEQEIQELRASETNGLRTTILKTDLTGKRN